jgi:hypothetical protein
MNEQLKKLLPELTKNEIARLYEVHHEMYNEEEDSTPEKDTKMMLNLLVDERCVSDAGNVFIKCSKCGCLYKKMDDNSGNESDTIADWYFMACPKCHNMILVSKGANIEREKKWNE